MKVSFYTTKAGRSPVIEYIEGLEIWEQARILEALKEIEIFGLSAVRVHFRQIERKLWELKMSAHRVFYVLLNRNEMLLLHAYKKQGQKLPYREKEVALRRMKEVVL